MFQVLISAGAGVVGLICVGFLIRGVLKASPGNEVMRNISRTIQQGARTFLYREYKTVAVVVVIVVAFLSGS